MKRSARILVAAALLTGSFAFVAAEAKAAAVKLGVGGSISFTATQFTPGPQTVTITVSRPTASVAVVSAETLSVSGDACALGLGGSFNVQVKLRPNPVPRAVFIVLQTTDASVGAGPPNYITPTSFVAVPLSTIGISATFSPGDPDHGCIAGSSASVAYFIPVGEGPGLFTELRFLGTQPFGYSFLPPDNLTVNFGSDD